MKFPRVMYRQTQHKKPRCQLYFPGFNLANGCWLLGSWVTVPEAEYESRRVAHQALFRGIQADAAKQHYRDQAVPLEALTEAQRLAYEHYSGQGIFYARTGHGIAAVSVRLAGRGLAKGQAEWLRQGGYKILRRIKNDVTGEVVDTLDTHDIPADLLADDPEPVNPWITLEQQNKQAAQGLFEACLDSVKSDETDPFIRGVAAGLSVQSLIDLEVGLIRQEWEQQRRLALQSLINQEVEIVSQEWEQQRKGRAPSGAAAPDIRQYAEMRAQTRAVLGDQFEALYEAQKATHNECARHNLGDHGLWHCFVLPKFEDDGSHEPWGERDVPWGVDL